MIIWTVCCVAITLTLMADDDHGSGHLIRVLLTPSIVLTPSMLSTLVIPWKIRNNAVWDRERSETVLTPRQSQLKDQVRRQNVSEALRDGEMFDLFMKFLHKEMSAELGYALIEFVQYKKSYLDNRKQLAMATTTTNTNTNEQQVQQQQQLESGDGGGQEEEKHNNDDDNEEEKEEKAVEEKMTVRLNMFDILRQAEEETRPRDYGLEYYPATAPKSTIVHSDRPGMSDDAKYRLIVHELWEKYIREGAKLEMNLKYDARQYYKKCAAKQWMMDSDSMARVFDRALQGIMKLLDSVYARYRSHLKACENDSE